MANSLIRLFFLSLFIFEISGQFIYRGVTAAESENRETVLIPSDFSIRYVTQFSSSRDFNKRANISRRFFDLLVGSNKKFLVKPIGIISTADHQWIIMDQGRHQIVRLNWNQSDFSRLGDEEYPSPVGVCIDQDETLYFTDSQLNRIYTGRISSGKWHILNDTLNISRPTGIAYLKTRKEIWVVETGRHQVTVIDRNGLVIKKIGQRGSRPGEFNFPTFIWIDKNELIYIVDAMNFRVQVMTQQGEIVFCFGEAGDATGYFARPKGIATDSFGNVYVVDALFHTVQIFNQAGQFLSNFGAQGSAPGQFWLPTGIYIDDHDKIYVADSYNSRIQVFQLMDGGRSEN